MEKKLPNCLRSFEGAPGGTRTPNLLIRSQTLYPLSYGCVWQDCIFLEGKSQEMSLVEVYSSMVQSFPGAIPVQPAKSLIRFDGNLAKNRFELPSKHERVGDEKHGRLTRDQ